MKIGVDFGSAYSTVSRYIENEDKAEALVLEEGGSSNIPSAVSVSKKGAITCGTSAKSLVGQANVYQAFKMFLVDLNEERKKSNGFTEAINPSYISKCFLEYLLIGSKERYGRSKEGIEELVICVPEIWKKNIIGADGSNILRNILLEEMPDDIRPGKVRVVTEPEAASAFFAHNYEAVTKKKFNGYLLLIDYGGGTLDITLNKIISDGNNQMEIRKEDSGGEGENHPDINGNYVIGNAGLSYIRKVVELAISDSGLLDEDELIDFEDKNFKHSEHQFENQLKNPAKAKKIELEIGQFGDYDDFQDILDVDDSYFKEPFCSIYYMGEEIDISYKHLYKAYHENIEGVLETELRKINETVEKCLGADPCSVEAGLRDDFKIALVGGFGNFYLVRKQIEYIYNFDPNSSNDRHVNGINTGQSEAAVSLGAALLASGRVITRKTANFSIGLYTENAENRKYLAYGIKFRQTINPGTPYYILSPGKEEDIPANRIKYGKIHNEIKYFVVEFSPALNKGFRLKLKPKMLKKLAKIPAEGLWCCGFSMDENDVITFHVTPAPGLDPEIYKVDPIELDRYSDMFEMTAGEEVYADEI